MPTFSASFAIFSLVGEDATKKRGADLAWSVGRSAGRAGGQDSPARESGGDEDVRARRELGLLVEYSLEARRKCA